MWGEWTLSQKLGPSIVHPVVGNLLEKAHYFTALLGKYPIWFRNILGPRLIGDDQVENIVQLLKDEKRMSVVMVQSRMNMGLMHMVSPMDGRRG